MNPATAHISAAACQGIRDAAQRQIDAAVRASSRSCTADSDCVTIHTIACGSDCGSDAIASSAAPAYKRATDAVRNGKCKAWNDGDCPRTTPMPIPSCPIYLPSCKEGTCTARMGP